MGPSRRNLLPRCPSRHRRARGKKLFGHSLPFPPIPSHSHPFECPRMRFFLLAEKPTMGATSGRNYIYIFFSFCSSFEPLGSHRTSSTRELCHIGQTFSTPPTHFERSTIIEISSTRGERTYRKKITDFSNTFGPLWIYRNCNQLRKIIMSERCFLVLWWKQTYQNKTLIVRSKFRQSNFLKIWFWNILYFYWMILAELFLFDTYFP
jgi:hypothetical protein